jgi:predicted nucleotidyltransferase
MVTIDAGTEEQLARVTREIAAAAGPRLVSIVLYGSAAGDDWVPGRSDLNLAVVVERVTLDVLEALAPVVARGRRHGLALPLILDRDWLAKARDAFPMELDDLQRCHRLLAGTDVFADLSLDRATLRRACEHEARGTLLRLRARFLDCVGQPTALDGVMTGSLKSVLVLLRHLLRLRGAPVTHGYADVLAAGEAALGPLPTMRRLLAHRTGVAPIPLRELVGAFGAYLAEVERLIAAIDGLDA